MTDLGAFLESARARIDDALDRAVPPLGTPPPLLHEAMRYAALAPGKRLRGAVVLATCDLLAGETDAAAALAGAIEMVHAASLILDDLPSMDNATLRRGRPALHHAFGEANAILTSVALLNLAFETIARAEAFRPAVRVEMGGRLARAVGADGLVGGQVADLAATGTRLGLEGLEYVHSHKTGALFLAAAEIGALAAGGKDRDLRALLGYAKNLGLAFQITDDLLDYSGSPETTGKDAGMDRDKTTFVDLCGIDGARRLVDELIDTSVSALQPFGRRRARLVALAELVRVRDR